MYETWIPFSVLFWTINPLEWGANWLNTVLWSAAFAWVPRVWYWQSFNYNIKKMSLLRGGRVVKIDV